MLLYQMIKKIWLYRSNFLISFVLIGIIVLPEAKYFHEWALAGIAGALLVSIVGLFRAKQSDGKATTLPDGLIIFLTSLICTAVFWYRAWINLPSDFLIEPVLAFGGPEYFRHRFTGILTKPGHHQVVEGICKIRVLESEGVLQE